jgi:hypothetical protein
MNAYNKREGAEPMWLAYDPKNGDLYKAVKK